MDDRQLRGAQKFFCRLTSAELFAAMERDSRLWKAKCPHCGAETSVWEMGGIRYKAAGEPRRRMRCRGCGRTGWFRFRWTGGDVTALGPRPSVVPLVVKIVILPLILAGGVAAILWAALR